MVVSIDITETPLRPNVRPEPPPDRRGPLTFIVGIEENNQATLRRNLTRGVNETDDPAETPTPTPTPGEDEPIALGNLILDLEAFKVSVQSGGDNAGRLNISLEAAVLSLNSKLNFSLPDNMVITPDDPSPT